MQLSLRVMLAIVGVACVCAALLAHGIRTSNEQDAALRTLRNNGVMSIKRRAWLLSCRAENVLIEVDCAKLPRGHTWREYAALFRAASPIEDVLVKEGTPDTMWSQALDAWPELQRVRLMHVELHAKDFRHIISLQNLDSLEFSHGCIVYPDVDMGLLGRVTTLREVTGCKLTARQFEAIMKVPSIRKVVCSIYLGLDANWLPPENSDIEYLSLHGCSPSREQLRALYKLPKLERLVIENADPAFIRDLVPGRNLRELYVEFPDWPVGTRVAWEELAKDKKSRVTTEPVHPDPFAP